MILRAVATLARVTRRAIRRVTTDVYGHILRLPLSYHLDNRKGGLAQSVERGTRALEELANVVLLSFLPIIIDCKFTSLP